MAPRATMIGLKFSRLTVDTELDARMVGSRIRRMFRCRCDCGKITDVLGENLRSGHSKSCGCLQDESRRAPAEPLAGRRFGKWVVINDAPIRHPPCGQSLRYLNVQCDCGTKSVVAAMALRNGSSNSCGCLAQEITGRRSLKHGDAYRGKQTKEYKAWAGMIERCENPNATKWSDYGGRGIKVCGRWRESYENFLADMGRKPSPKHSIDRWPHNDGDYEPDNCRWATASEQQRNKRNSKTMPLLFLGV